MASESTYLGKIILSSGQMMQLMVQNMTDLMKIMKGSLTSKMVMHNVKNSAQEIVELFEVQIKQKNLDFNMHISE